MREYEPIWRELKSTPLRRKSVSVTVIPALHKRVIKAVTKEKYNDLAFKLLCDPIQPLLEHTISGSVITFTLRYWGRRRQVSAYAVSVLSNPTATEKEP